MQKRVWMVIADAQTDSEGEQRRGQTQAQGTLEQRATGTWTLRYKDDDTQVTIDLTPDTVRVLRSGAVRMDMLFCAGTAHEFDYETPHGALEMAIHTDDAQWRLSRDGGTVSLRYRLHVGGQLATHNTLDIVWRDRQEGDAHAQQ